MKFATLSVTLLASLALAGFPLAHRTAAPASTPPNEPDARPIVYIAAPATATALTHTQTANAIWQADGIPLDPVYAFRGTTEGIDAQRHKNAARTLVPHAGAVYQLSTTDPEVLSQVGFAHALGIPVFTTQQEVTAWIADQLGSNSR